MRRRLRRVAGWGALATLLVLGVGLALERLWLGPTDQTALAHVAADTQDEFAGLTRSLATTAQQLAREPAPDRRRPRRRRPHARVVRPGGAAAGGLPSRARRRVGLRQRRAPVAWAGRPSTPPSDRLSGRSAVFVAPGSLVLRVVHVEPITATRRRRRGASAPSSPRRSSRATGRVRDPGASPIFESALVPLTLREVFAGAGETLSPYALQRWRPSGGTPLLTVLVPPRGLADLRAAWRGRAVGLALLALAVTLVLLVLVLRDALERERGAARDSRLLLLAMVALLVSARALVGLGHSGRLALVATACRAGCRRGCGRRWTGSPRRCWRSPWSRSCSTWWRAARLARRARARRADRAAAAVLAGAGRWPARWWGSCSSRTPRCCAASCGASGSHGLSFGVYPARRPARLVLVDRPAVRQRRGAVAGRRRVAARGVLVARAA